MRRALPPLGWFRAFEAAARHLNFTAAAEELGMTQSAVSQHVRALETRLGVALFLRKARGLALTDEGRKLLPQVGAALERLAAATETFDAGPARGLLTIATSVSVAQWILAPRLSAFLAREPGLRLRILGAIWPDDFNASIADVEIRFGSEKLVGAGARRLGADRLIAVAAPHLAPPFEAHPLIEAVGTSAGWRRWAEGSGYAAALEPTVHVDSYGLALDLARNGAGVALTSALLAGASLAAGEIVQAHPFALTPPEEYFIAARADSEAARAFETWIRAAVVDASGAEDGPAEGGA